MNPQVPRRSNFLAAFAAVALTLLFFNGAASAQQQKRDTKSETPVVGSPLGAIFDLGSSIITSATGYVSADPYAQFRSARYTNAGLLSERDELRLGNRLHQEVGKKFSLTSEGQERANRIGQRVARTSLRPNLAYRFHVISDKELNAFSIPGGHIYVTTALLEMANDDELASVLSHEIGHVVARHSLKTIQQSQALGSIVGLFGSITGIAGDTAGELGTAAAQIVASGLLAVHNREEEREADYLGVRAMPRAGFDAEGMVTMFQKLQSISRSNSSLLGSLFNDHPDVQERIDNTRFEINRMRSARSSR
ncbi:MAG TPA: M48 family metallopeptidase [Pyrinomonadaceae bacterium]|jgi:predicted Zn-dependent protease